MLIALTAMLCACGMQADIEDATSDAIAYMQAHRAEIDPASKTFVHFFGRKFDRAALRAFGPAAIQEFRDLPRDHRMQNFHRLLDPGFDPPPALLARELEGRRNDPSGRRRDSQLLRAVYCRAHPVNDEDIADLWYAIERGGYDLSHATLALAWYREQGCEFAQREGRYDHGMKRMVAELEHHRDVTDLSLNLTAYLLAFGERDAITSQWIARIIRAQRRDGGWPGHGPASGTSHWHATGLALWALLEYAHPEAPPTPMHVP